MRQSSRTTLLQIEALESRLNLSTLTPVAAPRVASAVDRSRIAGKATTRQHSKAPKVGATSLGAAGATAIPIGSYSSIYNCQLEYNGEADIGYVNPAGAYVEYTITAPSAGAYILSADLASLAGGKLQLSVNGVAATTLSADSTGSWSSYTNHTTSLQLAAGTNVLRFSSLNGTQYNLANFALTAAPTGNWITAGTYSAISNSQLESSPFGQDIGYDNPAGAYVEYTVNVPTTGSYSVTMAASTANSGATVHLLDNENSVATYVIPNTGGWQTYSDFSQTITLTAGTHTFRFATAPGSQYNLLQFKLDAQPATTVTTVTTNNSTSNTSSSSNTSTSSATAPVTIAQRWMTSFTELDITATAANESLTVSQFGNTFTITANGISQTVTGSFGDLVVYAGSGSSTVTIDSTVHIVASLYAGTGNDLLKNLTSAQATIVTLDGGADTVIGNGLNTAYWVDPSDTVYASTAEKAAGDIHSISSFYQPYTSTAGAAGYVTSVRDGSNLIDPTAATTGTTRLTSSSFWGTGPTQADINQGQASDCYFLTCLQSLARLQPGKLQQLAVDLGDGTYAVQFQRNGKTTYVRVDGDLPANGPYANGLEYTHPGASGNQWAAIMEKAYAYYRTGSHSYSSLDYGFMTDVWTDFGIKAATNALPSDANAFYNAVTAEFAANKPVDIATLGTITSGAPLVAAHSYAVTNVYKDSSGAVWVTLRNPWGFDGFNDDSNPGDGLITLSYSTLLANCKWDSMVS